MDKLIIKLLDSGYGEVIVKINRKGHLNPKLKDIYNRTEQNATVSPFRYQSKKDIRNNRAGKSDALQFLKDKLNN